MRTSSQSDGEITNRVRLSIKAKPNRPAKKGEPTGRKGKETRRSLMLAARRLLDVVSPLGLSAASISKEAGTSPATFYVYFDNVEDILWTICDAITDDTSDLFIDHSYLRTDERLEEEALSFVKGYCDIWARHGPLLQYRNMEADRGNARFNQLVLRIALPILEGLTDRIVESNPSVTRSEANAEAVVFIAAIDRIAAALHTWPNVGITPQVLMDAEARVLTRMLRRKEK